MSGSGKLQTSRWGRRSVASKDYTVQSVGSIPSHSGSSGSSVGPFIWDRLLDEDDATGSSPSVDIVFVHGLRGHFLKTWSTVNEHGSNVFWPADLLREDIEEARVISWGYDAMAASAQPGSTVSQNSIFGHAGTLLNDLADRRKNDPKRPILWVGHSLGGLVIKEAIIRAANSSTHGRDPRLGDLYSSTIGVIFMGTPHRGSPKASLGESAARLTSRLLAAGSNMQVLGNLRPDSHALEKQLHDFVTVSSHIPVVCIYEELKTGRAGLIVPKASAVYDGKMVSFNSIPADHRDMVRFSSRSDIGYTRVLGHIQSIWCSYKDTYRRKEEERAERERKKEDEIQKETREREEKVLGELLEVLAFRWMADREDRIEDAHRATLDWILGSKLPVGNETDDLNEKVSLFSDWLSKDGEPAFWVSGKAGSGKSTLMKLICRHEETTRKLRDWAQRRRLFKCHFFLYELGDDLGKCKEGMLRSVLHQLLSSDYGLELAKIAYPQLFLGMPITQGLGLAPTTSWRALREAFNRVLSAIEKQDWRICLFIDGLDEYRNVDKLKREQYSQADLEMVYEGEDGDAVWGSNVSIMDDHREILAFFKDLGLRSNIKLCLSSRELMIFEDGLGKLPRLRMQECTKSDISRFVNDQISQTDIDQDDKNVLTERITSRSCGVFLWVRLVVSSVLDGYACGDTIPALCARIDQAPSRLCGPRGLFMKMLEPVLKDPQARLESSRIFQMMNTPYMYKPSAIPVEWIWYGLESYTDDKENFELALQMPLIIGKPADLTKVRKATRRKVRGRSGCLLECEPPQYKVTFMHYSVYQLLSRKGIWDIFPKDPIFNPRLAYLSALVIRIKQDGKAAIDRWNHYEDPFMIEDQTFTFYFFQAMGVARMIDDEYGDNPVYINLVDELDKTMTEIYNQVPISQSNHCYWPHSASPRYENFLLNAAHWALMNYIRVKLTDPGDPATTARSGQQLLKDLIHMRSHFLTVIRNPDLVNKLENNHPYGDCWWATDEGVIPALIKLGAGVEDIWDQYLSLGYAIAFAEPPGLNFPIYQPPQVLSEWANVWITTLSSLLDLGGNPLQPAEITCDHWTHAEPLPTGKITLVELLQLMADRKSHRSLFLISEIERLHGARPKDPGYSFHKALLARY